MKKMIFISLFLLGNSLFAEVKYVSAPALGYFLAHKILKKNDHAKKYEYNTLCIQEAKNYLRMGINLRLSTVAASCLHYTQNRELSAPKTRSASHFIEEMKN